MRIQGLVIISVAAAACGAVPAEALPAEQHDGGSCEATCVELPLVLVGDAFSPTVIVADRSGSMEQETEAFGQKWHALKSVVGALVDSLDDRAPLGLSLFPSGEPFVAVCEPGDLVVPPVRGSRQDIRMALENTAPGGGTPVASTLGLVHAWLRERDMRDATLVLITDGEPNCNAGLDVSVCTCPPHGCEGNALQCVDEDATLASLRALSESGFHTYVIGLPGSADLPLLSAMAAAGGTGSADFRPSNPAELAEALRSVVLREMPCVFPVPGMPDESHPMEVLLAGAYLPRDTEHRQGWDRVDDQHVELFGAACETVRADPATAASVRFCR
jgi:hypothetical protein